MKGQAAVMDALIFMLIASGAATLLLFVSGLYSSSTNNQMTTIYNYEYGGNALIALHYAKDIQGKWFWNELKNKLNEDYADGIVLSYLQGDASGIWAKVIESSPAGKNTFLCFSGAVNFCCGARQDSFDCASDVPLPSKYGDSTVYSSSVGITSQNTVLIKLYY